MGFRAAAHIKGYMHPWPPVGGGTLRIWKQFQSRVWQLLPTPGGFWGVPMAFLGEKMRFPDFGHHVPNFRSFFKQNEVKNRGFSRKISIFWPKIWAWRSKPENVKVIFDHFWRFLLTFYDYYYFFRVKNWVSQIFVDLAPKLLILQQNQGFFPFRRPLKSWSDFVPKSKILGRFLENRSQVWPYLGVPDYFLWFLLLS